MKLLAARRFHQALTVFRGRFLLTGALAVAAVSGGASFIAARAQAPAAGGSPTPPPLTAPKPPPDIPPTIVVPTVPDSSAPAGGGPTGPAVMTPNAQPVPGAAFVGSTGCSSSMCHGGAGEKRGQWPIWSKQDPHGQDLRGTLGYPRSAYSALVLPWSNRIAQGLNISDARLSARCTSCHAPLHTVPDSALLASARADLKKENVEFHGVSCESCHGPASNWIRSHTRPDFTHAMNVQTGVRDLRNLYVRANTCVACHQNIDADILAAGHKPLYFELDSQVVAEPPHWVERNVGDWFGPQSWLVGQATALREVSWALSQGPNALGSDALRDDWRALVWLLQKASSAMPDGLPRIDVGNTDAGSASAVSRAQESADDLARAAARQRWTAENTRSLLQALAGTRTDFSNTSGETAVTLRSRARRLALALERMVSALRTRYPDQSGWPAATTELTALFDVVGAPEPDFDSAKFSAQLARFQGSLPP